MRHLRSRALIVAVAAMVSSGCFGSFQAVRTVYSWNKSFGDGNKWAQELMYIVIGGIVPVYGVAGFLDAVVLNSIEFWTGKNPMTASTTKSWARCVRPGTRRPARSSTQAPMRSCRSRALIRKRLTRCSRRLSRCSKATRSSLGHGSHL